MQNELYKTYMKAVATTLFLMICIISRGQIGDSVAKISSHPDEKVRSYDSSLLVINSDVIDFKLVFDQYGADFKGDLTVSHTKYDSDKNLLLYCASYNNFLTLEVGYDTCYTYYSEIDYFNELPLFESPIDASCFTEWDISINYVHSGCMDTPYYNGEVVHKKTGESLFLHCLRNVQAFEVDLNGDSRKELYLCSYIWCSSKLMILRIDAME